MSKRFVIIFSIFFIWLPHLAQALHSFGVISDIEAQSRDGEAQKGKSAFQNMFTFEQNWSDASSKAIGQLRIFQYFKKSDTIDTFLQEIYLAEANYEKNMGNQRFTVGYQSVYLSEGFNLIDTEIFHSKNNDLSVFSSPEKRYYTSPGVSYKLIGTDVSLQLAVLRFEKSERLSLLQEDMVKKSVPTFKPPTNKIAGSSDTDQLVKVLGSTSAFDWSTYFSRTYEKRVTIQYNPLKAEFSQISLPFYSFGLGVSGLFGQAVLRADYQKNMRRTFIAADNSQVQPDEENINISVEQTFGPNIRANVIIGNSKITSSVDIPSREKELTDLFLNFNYRFNDRLNLDVSNFERLNTQTSGYSIVFNSKIRENIELRYGIENFWTGPKSRISFLDQEDKIYLAIKATVF